VSARGSKTVPSEVIRLLEDQGHRLLGQPARPGQVSLLTRSTAIVASLTFGADSERVVVKRVPAAGGHPRARELLRIHDAIRSRDPLLAERTPAFLGADDETNLIIMSHVPGETLEFFLRSRSRAAGAGQPDYDKTIEQVADTLAAFNRIPAHEVGVADSARANRTFVGSLEQAWADPLIRLAVPKRYRSLRWLYDRLPPDFYGREFRQLAISDTSPKNVLYSYPDSMNFVDLAYTVGNPVQNLAEFLAAMDRMAATRPRASVRRQVRDWQRRLVARYLGQNPAALGDGLVFFYPWALLQTFRLHSSCRRWWRPYLAWYYGGCLRSFFALLDELSGTGRPYCPSELFGTAAG
jgi:hypothetical protein